MTAPSEDAVGVARTKYDRAVARLDTTRSIEFDVAEEEKAVEAAWLEVIRAVRAECAADTKRLDWLVTQTQPNHGVILCALDLPNEEKWASVQRVNQFHNPHKVEWCVEDATLRAAIDRAMLEAK